MADRESGGSVDARDVVELRLPADAAYLGVVRTATAGLAARLDFTLDEIEDLRIAVDEACAILLPDVVPGESVECVFALDGEVLDVTVSARIDGDHRPEQGSFGWTVLEALTGSVAAVSVGVVDGVSLLDLDYSEDSNADVDVNVVMTGDGRYVEVQSTAEKVPFDRARLDDLLDLAAAGIEDLQQFQQEAVAAPRD